MSQDKDGPVRFIATHVRRGDDPALIDALRLLERVEGEFEDRELVDRKAVIAMLEDDERIFLWDHDADDLGAELFVEYLDVGERFLRIDEQEIAEDDLGDLPDVG